MKWLLLTLVIILFSHCDQVTDPGNHTPVLQQITFSPTTPSPGETVTLHAIATDGDKDSLEYSWHSKHGKFQKVNGNPVKWFCPVDTGQTSYSISCVVNDGSHIDSLSQLITIQPVTIRLQSQLNAWYQPDSLHIQITGMDQTEHNGSYSDADIYLEITNVNTTRLTDIWLYLKARAADSTIHSRSLHHHGLAPEQSVALFTTIYSHGKEIVKVWPEYKLRPELLVELKVKNTGSIEILDWKLFLEAETADDSLIEYTVIGSSLDPGDFRTLSETFYTESKQIQGVRITDTFIKTVLDTIQS